MNIKPINSIFFFFSSLFFFFFLQLAAFRKRKAKKKKPDPQNIVSGTDNSSEDLQNYENGTGLCLPDLPDMKDVWSDVRVLLLSKIVFSYCVKKFLHKKHPLHNMFMHFVA